MSDNSRTEDLIPGDSMPQVHSIDMEMSAPSIESSIDSSDEVKGHGLALADVTVEQDRAYWEWRIRMSEETASTSYPMFGVSNKRNAKFYEILAGSTIPSHKHGTKFMCDVSNLNDGDVIGVIVKQSEIPMIQLTLNGVLQQELSINRFKGTVYPAIFLPECTVGSMSAKFLYREDQFAYDGCGAPPLIAGRSIM
jgi:hypothetical protein